MPRQRLMLVVLAAVAVLLGGCSTPEDNTIDLPVDITSRPDKCTVHFRVVLAGKAKNDLPETGDWVYLGRTPYTGEAKLPKEFVDRKEASVQFRVTKPEHRAVLQNIESKALDLQSGVRFKAELSPMWSDAP